MKKLMNFVMVLVLCFASVLPVAAEEPFVPSISYKGGPEIVPNEDGSYGALLNSSDWSIVDKLEGKCLRLTPLSEVEASDVIPEEEKEWIINAYRRLLDKSMEIPYEGEFEDLDMVIRELFDLRLLCDDGHDEELQEDGVVLEITLDLGVDKNEKVSIMIYAQDEWLTAETENNTVPGLIKTSQVINKENKGGLLQTSTKTNSNALNNGLVKTATASATDDNGKWVPAAKVTNNGDGTVTIAVEECGLIAASVPAENEPAKTGDINGANIAILTICAVAAAGVLTGLLFVRHRKATNK